MTETDPAARHRCTLTTAQTLHRVPPDPGHRLRDGPRLDPWVIDQLAALGGSVRGVRFYGEGPVHLIRWHRHLVAGSVGADRLLFVRAASEPAPFLASP